MKYYKFFNLIPLVMFVLMDMILGSDIMPIRFVIVAALVIMNVLLSGSMKDYLVSSLILVVSTVVGVILRAYYSYYFIEANPDTPIVGAAVMMVYAIFVLTVAAIGIALFAIRNKADKTVTK